MYQDHPKFTQPEDEEIRVWRYMNFAKLVSLINSRKLHFSRADKLGDPFEGSMPKKNVAAKGFVPESILPEMREKFLSLIRDMGKTKELWPRNLAINCWHMNKHESAAMWRLYLKSDEGIAIQSTYAKLKRSLIDDEKVYLGKVKYIDYDTDFIDPNSTMGPFMHKRMSYAYEQEVRAIILKMPIVNRLLVFKKEMEIIENGLEINVDLETLIECIYVAPTAKDWFADLVKAIISKYGYEFKVTQSKLNEDPVF